MGLVIFHTFVVAVDISIAAIWLLHDFGFGEYDATMLKALPVFRQTLQLSSEFLSLRVSKPVLYMWQWTVSGRLDRDWTNRRARFYPTRNRTKAMNLYARNLRFRLRSLIFEFPIYVRPITVAARSKVRSNTGVVGSNPTRVMDVCQRLFCVYVVLCR
jgi:hypothetical protein